MSRNQHNRKKFAVSRAEYALRLAELAGHLVARYPHTQFSPSEASELAIRQADDLLSKLFEVTEDAAPLDFPAKKMG